MTKRRDRRNGTEASPDPWKAVARLSLNGEVTHSTYHVYMADAVDRARAAVEAQHRADIAQERMTTDYWKAEHLAAHVEIDQLTAERDALAAQVAGLREALQRLADCDWTIGRGDRMDPVRDIARAALAATEPGGTDGD